MKFSVIGFSSSDTCLPVQSSLSKKRQRFEEFGFLFIVFLSKGRDSDALSSKKVSCFFFNRGIWRGGVKERGLFFCLIFLSFREHMLELCLCRPSAKHLPWHKQQQYWKKRKRMKSFMPWHKARMNYWRMLTCISKFWQEMRQEMPY